MQGLFVLPGVIDSDYTGQLQALLWTPSPPVFIPAGSRIAQLVPFKNMVRNRDPISRGAGGFGSTGEPNIFWTQLVQRTQPTLTCTLKNKGSKPEQLVVKGMIDTGADVTIISTAKWPGSWETIPVNTGLVGIGGLSTSRQSANLIQIVSPEGQIATIRPFVVPVLLNLWGRDVLSTWGLVIGTADSHQHF